MRCDSFEIRLNEVLDQRGSPSDDRDLRAHAASCANCRGLLVGQQFLFTGLDLADPPEMSSGFTGRVLARLAQDSAADSDASGGAVAPVAAGSGMNRVMWWTGGIVAAALVVAVVGWEPLKGFFMPAGPENGPVQPLAKTDKPAVPPEKQLLPAPPQPESKPPPLVQKPSETPKIPMVTDPQLGRLLEAVQTNLPTEEGSELASQFVDGLRPIAEPMNSVLNVVRRGLLGESGMQEAPPRKPQAGAPSTEGFSALS